MAILAGSVSWEKDILAVVQQTLRDETVPESMLDDVVEFFAGYQIFSSCRMHLQRGFSASTKYSRFMLHQSILQRMADLSDHRLAF